MTYSLSGDDVLSLSLVELGNSLDDHVVTFRSSTRKDNILGSSSNKISNMLPSLIDSTLCLPSISVCPTMGISILFREEWHHLVEHPRVHGGGSLRIEVDWSSF